MNKKAAIRAFLCSPQGWLVLLLCFHLCANIWWLWADNHAIRTDEETHMIMARDYYSAFFPSVGDKGLGTRLHALVRIRADVGNPVHPPMLHIAGAVLVRIIGYSVDRLAFTNTLAFLAALIGVYCLARLFLDDRDAFFATMVVSFTPMIYASSRYFMTDFMSMALVVWVIYALLRSDWFRHPRWVLLFGLLNGLALLTRTTAVLYYLLPSMVIFAGGLVALLERHDGRIHFNQVRFAKLLLNAALSVGITLAVASPWYLMHGRQFYEHWMKPHQGGMGAPIALLRYDDGTPEAPGQPAPRETEEAAPERTEEATPRETEEEAAPAVAPTRPGVDSGRWRLFLRRNIPWSRYPVFVINNAVFLPMFFMGLAGMVVCLACARFRKRLAPLLLLVWLLGSYYLLTIVLTFSTPRYAMQALPALALLSALPVLALPRGALRRAAQFLYIGVLLFQYGNLTVHAYGPLAEVKVPVILDERFQAVYDDPGLYVYKSVLHASSAYGRMQAPMQDNFKDRLFFAMLKEEQERPFYGIEAPYARLNIRGMILDERHFWKDMNGKNPFRRKDIPSGLEPYRNLRHYGWGREMGAIEPLLNIVDYVAYTTEGITPEREQEWLQIFEEHGFELVDRFFEERFGQVHPRHFGLVARKTDQRLPAPKTVADVRELNFTQLYQVRHSAVYAGLSPEIRQAVGNQMHAFFDRTKQSMSMNDCVDFMGAAVEHEKDDWYSMRLILYVRKPVTIPYRLMFRGEVAPRYMASHFGNHTGQAGVFRWNFDPTPSPLLWPAGDFVILRFPVGVKPIPYNMSFAFFDYSDGVWGDAVNLGQIHFGEIVRKE